MLIIIIRSNNRFVRQNLEDIFSIKFPTPQEQTTINISNECGICYCYQLKISETENSIPDQICSYSKCSRIFHYDCLVDWLQSVPTNNSSFGTIFGFCPYCQEPISVKAFR